MCTEMKDSPSSQGSQGTVRKLKKYLDNVYTEDKLFKTIWKAHRKNVFRKRNLDISKRILSECARLKVQKFSPLLFKLEVTRIGIWKLASIFYYYIRKQKGRLCLQACLTSLSQKRIKEEGGEEYRCNMPDTIEITTKEHVFVCLHFLNSVGRIKYFSNIIIWNWLSVSPV